MYEVCYITHSTCFWANRLELATGFYHLGGIFKHMEVCARELINVVTIIFQ